MNPTNNDNFNKTFRERFQDFEDHNISEDNWDAIQSKIPQKASFLQKNGRKVSLLLCLLLISTCVWQSKWDNSSTSNPQINIAKQAIDNNTLAIIEKEDPSVKNAILPSNSVSNANVRETSKVSLTSTSIINKELNSNSNSINKNELINNELIVVNKENKGLNTVGNRELNSVNKNELINDFNSEKELTRNTQSIEITPLLTQINVDKLIDFDKNNAPITSFNSIINSNKKQFKRTSLFVAVTPQYSFFNFTPNTKDKLFLSQFELTNQLSIKRLGIKIETGVSYQLTKHLAVNLALNVQSINKTISYSTQTNVLDSFKIEALNALNIRIERIANLHKLQEQNNYYLVGLNSGLTYTIGRGKMHYFVAGSLGINKLLNQTQLSSINWDMSIGIQQKISNQYSLSIAPQINYFVQKETFSSPILQAKPYTIGLKMQIMQQH